MRLTILTCAVLAAASAPLVSQQAHQPAAPRASLVQAKDAPVADRLFFDEIDGVVWVRGNDYKASFSKEAFSFIPFLGSDAPRSFPLTFSLDAIEAGGESLVVAQSNAPVRLDREITIDRGAVAEIYSVESGQVEQLFRFDRSPGTGDVVVRMTITTDLEAAGQDDGGFIFSSSLGGVRYGRAEVVDAAGRKAPVETSRVGDAIELKVAGAFLRDAVYPVTIDPTLISFGLPATGPFLQDFKPDVAYDLSSDLWAVAYEEVYSATDHDIFVRMYDTLGNSMGSAYVDFTTSSFAVPKIANNNIANQFLVVAEKTLSGGAVVIFGRTVQASAAVTMGPQFQISAAELGIKSHPDVGGDPSPLAPTYYCVTWQSTINGVSNVYYNLVQSNSTVIFAISPFVGYGPVVTNDTKPSISKSDGNGSAGTQDWVIVYQRTYSPTDEDIWGAIVHWDGALVNGAFPIDLSGNVESNPSVSSVTDEVSGTRQWLAVYERLDPGNPPLILPNYDIVGALFTGSTGITSANLTSLLGAVGYHDQIHPCVDTDGCRFTLGFTDTGSFADQGTPYVATVHVEYGATLSVTEYPVSVNAYAGLDDDLQISSKHSGGGVQYRYMTVHDVQSTTNSNRSVLAAMYDGWSAVASGGPSTYINYVLPGCGGLSLSVTGFPALGLGMTASLSGVQGTPYLVVGASMSPLALCTGCLLGVDPTTATIIQADTLSAVIPCEGGLVDVGVAVQGADIGSSTGCSGAPSFSLSETVIITIL